MGLDHNSSPGSVDELVVRSANGNKLKSIALQAANNFAAVAQHSKNLIGQDGAHIFG
jgi:hypothetical protein